MSDELYRRVMRYLSKNGSESAERLNKKLEIKGRDEEFNDEIVTFVLANNLHNTNEMREILDVKIRYFKKRNKEGLAGEYGDKTRKDLEYTLERYNLMIILASQI